MGERKMTGPLRNRGIKGQIVRMRQSVTRVNSS